VELYQLFKFNKKDVISGHPEEKDKRTSVIHSLPKSIKEANWAVAGLLEVADVLERFQTVSANRIECLFVLDKLFRLAKYTRQLNQKPGLWRKMKCVATAIIVASSIKCCTQIDQSKFSLFDVAAVNKDRLDQAESQLVKN